MSSTVIDSVSPAPGERPASGSPPSPAEPPVGDPHAPTGARTSRRGPERRRFAVWGGGLDARNPGRHSPETDGRRSGGRRVPGLGVSPSFPGGEPRGKPGGIAEAPRRAYHGRPACSFPPRGSAPQSRLNRGCWRVGRAPKGVLDSSRQDMNSVSGRSAKEGASMIVSSCRSDASFVPYGV